MPALSTITSLPAVPAGGFTHGARVPIDDASGVTRSVSLTDLSNTVGDGAFSVRAYGAKGDGTTDDTDAVLQAVAAARASGLTSPGGQVVFPPGTYVMSQEIDLDTSINVTLRGASGPRASGNATGASLQFTQGGSGNCINVRSSIGFRMRDLRVTYTNAAFTGRVVNADSRINDTQYLSIAGCEIGGTDTAYNAAYGLTLGNVVIASVEHSIFSYTHDGICGQPSPGYSNAVQIENNTFWLYGRSAIRNAGEAWLVKGNTFEGSRTAAPGAYTCDEECIGPLTFQSNWFGDAYGGGGPWIQFAGQQLVCIGNLFGPGTAADGAIAVAGITGAVQGVTLFGNRFLTDTPIHVTGAYGVYSFVALGNSFATATPIVDAGSKLVSPIFMDRAAGVLTTRFTDDLVFTKTGGPDDRVSTPLRMTMGALGVNNTTPATTLGSVQRCMPVYAYDGVTLLGYLPLYNSIT